MRIDVVYRILISALLASVLLVQMLILRRMPSPTPTMADIVAAPAENRRNLLMRIPLARVNGSVVAQIENTPLEVDVQNIPLEVEIQR